MDGPGLYAVCSHAVGGFVQPLMAWLVMAAMGSIGHQLIVCGRGGDGRSNLKQLTRGASAASNCGRGCSR